MEIGRLTSHRRVPPGKSPAICARQAASRRGIAVGQFHNPVGEEETQHAHDEFRDAKNKIGQGGGGTGITLLATGQEVFKKAVEAAPNVIQAVKNAEKSDGSNDDTKETGWFHAATIKTDIVPQSNRG